MKLKVFEMGDFLSLQNTPDTAGTLKQTVAATPEPMPKTAKCLGINFLHPENSDYKSSDRYSKIHNNKWSFGVSRNSLKTHNFLTKR